MSVRPPILAILLASAALALAMPAQAANGLCEGVTTPAIHVGVAVDGDEPCSQDCPSMVNVNVAVSINGDIRQCSESGNLLNSQAHAPLCGISQDPWTTDCDHVGEGLWAYVECISRPGLGICPFPPLDVR